MSKKTFKIAAMLLFIPDTYFDAFCCFILNLRGLTSHGIEVSGVKIYSKLIALSQYYMSIVAKGPIQI